MISNLFAISYKNTILFLFVHKGREENLRMCIITILCIFPIQHPLELGFFFFFKLKTPTLSFWGPLLLYSGSMWFSSG